MRVRRSSRRGVPLGICGCLVAALLIVVVLAVGVVFVFLRTPSLALLVAGFKPQGSTAQVFSNQANTPPIQLDNPVTPPQAVVNLGSSGTQELPASNVQTGTINGSAAAAVTFSESDLMNLCVQRTTLCSNTNPQYKNVKVDLQPDGGIVYADVNIPELGLTQNIGVALKLDATHRQFEVMGVDVGGTLYGLPTGELGQRVLDIETKANELLQAASLDVGAGVYNLSDIHIDANSITFVMQ